MMATKHASFPVQIKAIGDQGEFEAIVSVFNNVDLDGERVMPTAFDRSLLGWRMKGTSIPVLFGHDHSALIGGVRPGDAQVTKTDLRVKGRFDLGSRLAQEAYVMARDGLLTKWSFGYDVKVARPGTDGVLELHDLDLGEVSITARPANPQTGTLAVKSAVTPTEPEPEPAEPEPQPEPAPTEGVKAGRRLSQATVDEMKSIHDNLTALQERMRALMGVAEEEPAKSEIEAPPAPEPEPPDDQEPKAKSRPELDLRVEHELAAFILLKENR